MIAIISGFQFFMIFTVKQTSLQKELGIFSGTTLHSSNMN